jgi:TP901-1 family phage major tail protein
MAKVAGRKIKVYAGTGPSAVAVAGGRSDSISINNEATDVTDKSSDGWRELHNEASVSSVDITASGLIDGPGLIGQALGATTALVGQYEVRIEGIGTASGEFHFSSYEIEAAHDGAGEYSMTLASSGPITWVVTP